MCEGFVRELKGDRFDPYSAGIRATDLDPIAASVMKEIGIDISNQHSKTLDELGISEFDYVITVCDNAREACPFFPFRIKLMHKAFQDPKSSTIDMEESRKLVVYRRIRDEIKQFVLGMPESLND
jgi:arsenate reductase